MANVIIHLLGIFFVCYAVISFSQELYSKFDHSKLPSTLLKKDAVIVDFKSERVKYIKNGAKFKTNVIFSDGFVFTTFRTNNEPNDWRTYKISIDSELFSLICEKAIIAHNKAYERQSKKSN